MTESLKEQIVDRVMQRIDELGLSARAVGLSSGHGPDLVRDWLRAKGLPRIDSLIKVAVVLKTTPEWLAFGTANPETLAVPVLTMVSAGAFKDTETIETVDYLPTIRITDLPKGDWVALRVDGDSMDRISPPDSLILVNRQQKALMPNSCYVIFDDDSRATYKRYKTNPERFEPVSTNAAHETIFPDNGNSPQVFGRVFKTILDL